MILDFLDRRPIPLTAFTSQCPGSYLRLIPVVVADAVTHYCCSECAATFTAAEAEGVGVKVAPGHRPNITPSGKLR